MTDHVPTTPRTDGWTGRTDDQVDVLIPTKDRPAALAVTLGSLLGQTVRPARVIVADQGDRSCLLAAEVRAVVRTLEIVGCAVEAFANLPRRGLAHQRHQLLERARSPYVLFLDDDVLVEPDLIHRLLTAIHEQRCGFIGSFANSPSGVTSSAPVDEPPADVDLEPWPTRVRPEVVLPGSTAWHRYRLHFAAYLHRIGARRGITKRSPVIYRVAWVGGCLLFDADKLRDCGGFNFWPGLPVDHSGEDVIAQLRVMARYGGAGLAPSSAWHQEVPTTRPGGEPDAPYLLDVAGLLGVRAQEPYAVSGR